MYPKNNTLLQGKMLQPDTGFSSQKSLRVSLAVTVAQLSHSCSFTFNINSSQRNSKLLNYLCLLANQIRASSQNVTNSSKLNKLKPKLIFTTNVYLHLRHNEAGYSHRLVAQQGAVIWITPQMGSRSNTALCCGARLWSANE